MSDGYTHSNSLLVTVGESPSFSIHTVQFHILLLQRRCGGTEQNSMPTTTSTTASNNPREQHSKEQRYSRHSFFRCSDSHIQYNTVQ